MLEILNQFFDSYFCLQSLCNVLYNKTYEFFIV